MILNCILLKSLGYTFGKIDQDQSTLALDVEK